MGNLDESDVQIANIPLEASFQAAYAAYVDKKLERIAVINMREYNYTVNGTTDVPNPVPRPSQEYTFNVPNGLGKEATIQSCMRMVVMRFRALVGMD